MILYGRYLSPYVRRVALWLGLQGRPFEHRPILVTGEDFDRLRELNPLGRVPALALGDGETLIETGSIIDWLEDSAPDRRLLPPSGVERRDVMRVIGYADGLAEKVVALVYERQRRPSQYHWPDWQARLESQITGALDWLEACAPDDGFHGGSEPSGVDAAVIASFDHGWFMHPELVRHPKLQALSQRADRIPLFAQCHPRVVKE